MKQKITLLIFMVLASVFTFGQNTVQKRYKNEHLNEKKSERSIRVLDFKTKQRPVLKSTNAEKQQLDYSIEMDWNSETSQWENSDKYEYTYDANGNPTVEIDSDWNSETSQWKNSDKSEYTYDANGNPTVGINSDWNSETSQWENYSKYESTYDANGNPTVVIYSRWNSETSQWKNYDKSEYTYDLSYSLNDLILPNIYSFAPSYSNLIVNKPVDFISYDYGQGSWVNSSKGTYQYSTVNGTSVSGLNMNAYSIYPNPASDNINFNITNSNNTFTFELYDSQGRKLISKEITNNRQLSLEGLAKGIYLYNLNIDGEIQSGKLIKE
jgi:hypothetical protein